MPRFSKTQVAGLFITGAAAGAVTALLLAPKTGSQMRKDIRKISRKTMNQIDDLRDDIREQISERYSQVRKMIKTA
jgi:gas vesicle protein